MVIRAIYSCLRRWSKINYITARLLDFIHKKMSAVLLAALFVSGCHYTKRLEKGQYLVEKNTIVVKGDKISESELETVLKTQTNRKIFGKPRFHLWLYNIPSPKKIEKRSARKTAKRERKNVNRIKKGKEPKPVKKTFGQWLQTSVGEPPVLLDSAKVRSSTRNLSNYLFKKGYFNNKVRDSIVLDSTHKKVYLYYFVQTSKPYLIDTFMVTSEDKKILKQIKTAQTESLIKKGDRLDINVLDDERNRLVSFLKDRGYYDLNKEVFSYRVDSALSNHRVSLTMSIARILRKVNGTDSTFLDDHRRYTINNIYVFTDDFIQNDSLDLYDTTLYNEHYFIYRNRPSMRPSNLEQHIYLNKGNYFRQKEVEFTYKKLSSLGVYKSTNISFKQNNTDPANPYLDCFINLRPLKRQTFLLESDGTNRGGNLGISGNVSYRNKNLFRGAEALKISLKGGIEAQQLLSNQEESTVGENVGIGDFKPLNTFNTIEFGPEISLTIPKFFFPFVSSRFKKSSSPKTVFTALLNFQQRPDFTRGIQEAQFGYEFNVREHVHINATLFKLSAVKINPSDEFRERLNSITDPFLKYSYTDHIIFGSQGQLVYNVKRKNKYKDNFYLKGGGEIAGLLLRNILEQTSLEKDSIGSYEILGIRFAQFIKADFDVRYAISFNKSSQIVYRVAGGIGVPMENLNEALPFEKSFFVGGSNGLRAFRARTIGPGSFYDTTVAFDKTGDILMEGNIEYRFDLLKIVKGALFYDVGNVWLIKPNPGKPGGEISREFYKQLAMGAGLGLRFDLDFFIFRFDFAYPLRQPSLPEGEKWFFQSKTKVNEWLLSYAQNNGLTYEPFKSKMIVNIGIGYPF